MPEGPLTLQDDGTAAEQADLRYLWQGHDTPSEISRDSSGSGGPRQDSGRVVEESLYSLTRCFGDLYAQHHGVSAEPEVRIVTLDELEAAGWRTPLVLLGTGSVRDLCQASSPSQWAASPLVPPSGAKPAPLLQRTEALVKALTDLTDLTLTSSLTLTRLSSRRRTSAPPPRLAGPR